jgi:hypothetical protein
LKKIKQGDEFTLKQSDGSVSEYRREKDDPEHVLQCERIRVTHLSHNMVPKFKPYTFGTEQEWFKQRGLVAEE